MFQHEAYGREYYEEEFNKTLEEWKKFINDGETADMSVVPDEFLIPGSGRGQRHESHLEPVHKVLTGRELEELLTKTMTSLQSAGP